MAPADLEFAIAARLRDEIKRLTAVELTLAGDPFARQSAVDAAVDAAFLKAARDGNDPPSPAGEGDRALFRTRWDVSSSGALSP